MAHRIKQDPIKPYSPQRNFSSIIPGTGMRIVSSSESDSNVDHSDSNVSDMIQDTTEKFANIKTKRKSRDGDFVPHSSSRSGSDSESKSTSSKSDRELVIAENSSVSSKDHSSNRSRSAAKQSDGEESDNGSSRALSYYGARSKQQNKLSQSSLVNRDSPFTFKRGNHSNFRESNARYSYELCPPSFDIIYPRRQAAVNVRYQFSDNESDQSDDSKQLTSKRRGRQQRRNKSESEFEASDATTVSSNDDNFIAESAESEEEYRPSRRRGATKNGSRTKVVYSLHPHIPPPLSLSLFISLPLSL